MTSLRLIIEIQKVAGGLQKLERKVLWTRKGVRATVVTAGHCSHAELTSSRGLC